MYEYPVNCKSIFLFHAKNLLYISSQAANAWMTASVELISDPQGEEGFTRFQWQEIKGRTSTSK